MSSARSGGKRNPERKNDPTIEPIASNSEGPEDGAAEPDERRVGRVGAAVQHRGRHAGADHGSGDDPGDREQAR